MKHLWLKLTKTDLEIELLQSEQEGRDVSALRARVAALDETDPSFQAAADGLYAQFASCPRQQEYEFEEPSGWDEILATVVTSPQQLAVTGDLEDRIYGGWLGRCAGCLLGKPIEGWHRTRLHSYLKASKQFPLNDYISIAADQQTLQNHQVDTEQPFKENVNCMVEDDDINYTVTGLGVIERYGREFSASDVSEFWLDSIPILRTCTAERVAYRNVMLGIAPPDSATHRNPYREWIGAQIRADFWGYINPGDPMAAAEMAFRDASVSHIKNGIYGEMWAAAMVAQAFAANDARECVTVALKSLPPNSRLAQRINHHLKFHDDGGTVEQAVNDIHSYWNEANPHDWCHTISNAEVVAVGLLYGENEFEKSICIAVDACFDTDCNGATVGSVLGAMIGSKGLPKRWTGILNDTVQTGVRGFGEERISKLAARTAMLAKKE
ncbi:MAG: ADP-ribosylglycohydrolase family protein [Fimbriimonadales bacterium]